MDIFSFTDKGLRENNEDYLLNRQLSPDCSIHLVADGMGGCQYGEVASSIACHAIADYLESHFHDVNPEQNIRDSIDFANDQIRMQRESVKEKLGTTIAGALICRNKAWAFWLGDVRIYHFREGQILFQSEDHSLVNEMKKERVVSPKDIIRYGNIVTKSIAGNTMPDRLPIFHFELSRNDQLVLCTDGFWRNINLQLIIHQSKDTLQNSFFEMGKKIDDNYSILWIGN